MYVTNTNTNTNIHTCILHNISNARLKGSHDIWFTLDYSKIHNNNRRLLSYQIIQTVRYERKTTLIYMNVH